MYLGIRHKLTAFNANVMVRIDSDMMLTTGSGQVSPTDILQIDVGVDAFSIVQISANAPFDHTKFELLGKSNVGDAWVSFTDFTSVPPVNNATSLTINYNSFLTVCLSSSTGATTMTNVYSSQQTTVINTLTTEQQATMANGSIADRAVIISTMSVVNQALFATIATLAKNYNAEQLAVIDTLTPEQQATFATGTTTQKNAILLGLTPAQQAPFTSTPVQFIQTAQQIADDKLSLDQIVTRLRAGQFINDDDSVFYALGNSLMAVAAMQEIDAGRGFDGLRNIGLTQTQAIKVLSIYNVKIDTGKYESELALTALNNNPATLPQLIDYLDTLNLPLPPLGAYLGEIRANHAVYAAIAGWKPVV